jgi:asparagine synthase (glutamine-hydrolysing)
MCGILGFNPRTDIDSSVMLAMAVAMRHRGPDDEGFLISGGSGLVPCVGDDTPSTVVMSLPGRDAAHARGQGKLRAGTWSLGHRRLSILDLSASGHQPMSYRERFWIVYNGEVYNYVELRRLLERCGHTFRSTSDTEVILAAYCEWGAGCLSRFNGMWGLAIADLDRRTLFLARDRFGVKPLYLRVGAAGTAFASEIKAFAVLPDWKPVANIPRVIDFLAWELSDHTAETMFADVRQLPAGHHLTLPLDRQPTISEISATVRWYELKPAANNPDQSPAQALRGSLADAVRLRLRADVPVGSCLSGGVDSSSIVALMAEELRRQGGQFQQQTVTACSHDSRFDESQYAKAVIASVGAEATFITPDPGRLFADLDRLVWHQDEPFVSTSIFAQWCVFHAARCAGVKVMLDGQGADESLGGYRGFIGAHLAGLLRRGQMLEWLREVRKIRKEIGFPFHRCLGYSLAYLAPALRGLLGRFDHRSFGNLAWLDPRVRKLACIDPARVLGGRAGSVRNMSLAMIRATNLPMLLRWEDRNSMAASVEARVPFLDFRLVELALGIDDQAKIGGGIQKLVLREAMRGSVPDQILDRKDKMGFVTAEKTWMLYEQPDVFRDRLVQAVETLSGVVNSDLIDQFDDMVDGRRPFDHRYWRVLCLGTWARIFNVTGLKA